MIGIRRKKDSEAEKDITKQNQPVLVGFRSAYVFDRLSRDLCPARARPVSRTTPVYGATATESNQVVWQNAALYPVDYRPASLRIVSHTSHRWFCLP